MFADYVEKDYFENRLLLCPNPLMALALSAELMQRIGSVRKRFENKCNALKDELMLLGKLYNSKIDNEKYFKILLMDTDFKNRTVLKIIVDCQLAELMHEDDPKAAAIMMNMYIGEESNMCDGSVYGYSNYMHIITSKARKDVDGNMNIWKCVTSCYNREDGF